MGQPGNTPEERAATLGPGTRLGKYEIVRLLGAGGMGAVYEASHTEIGKRVAIKVLSPAITAVPGARARFLREAQLTSRVRHPNIVDVTDMGSDAGQTYLVMEFLRGEDLSQRLDRTGPIPARDLADIMIPVCSAVVAAHQAGVTHRDLKPQNIFLAAGPHAIQPKVLDFGISKGNDIVGGGALTGTGAMIGTPFYLAPEQIMDARSAGPPSDQYALGVILYECLTACRPFESESLFVVFQAIVTGSPVRPRERRPDLDIPSALEEIVLKAMSVDPKGRFASTQNLGRALLPFASARMRSIWEEAFTIPAGDGEPAAQQSGPVSGPRPLPRVSTTQSSTPAVQTPGAMPQRVPPVATPGPTAPVTSPIYGRPAERRERFVGVTQVEMTGDGAFEDSEFGASTSPFRSAKWIGVFVGIVAGGLIVTFLALRTPTPIETTAPASPKAQTVVAPAASSMPPTKTAAPVVRPPSPVTGAPEPAPTALAQRRAPTTFKVSVSVVPETATIVLDGAAAGQGHIERSLPIDHVRHALRFSADGFDDRTVEFVDTPPPAAVTLMRLSRPEPARPAVAPVPPRPKRNHAHGAPPHSLNPNGAPVID
jgi:serine/threonine protein kinase